MRILLIEDDSDLARLLDRVRADEGYAATRAGDGHTGLHLALRARPARRSGWSCQRLRSPLKGNLRVRGASS